MARVSRPFRVDRASTIGDVEKLLVRLEGEPGDRDLLLASSLKRRQLGGTTAMLQLLASWHRQCPEGRLRAHIGAESERELRERVENFITADHGLFAWGLAGQLRGRDGVEDLTALAEALAAKRLEGMNGVGGAQRGNKVFLLCLDNRPRYAAPETLYQPRRNDEDEPALRSRAGFAKLAGDLRTEIGGKTSRARRGRNPNDDRGLAVLLRELVTNTHDWARASPSAGRYERSVRGLRIELHNLSVEDLGALTSEHVLVDFLQRASPNIGDRLHLVELSIFDCGPGLAARRLWETGVPPGSVEAEYEAVRDCLRTHFSSSNEPPRGVGLHEVLLTISGLGGLLRVRTGRLQLYRDFTELPYDPGHKHDEPFLQDWENRLALTPAAPAAGTFYTLLFPLPYG